MKKSTRVRVSYGGGYCLVDNDKGRHWKYEYSGTTPRAGAASIVASMLTETVFDCLNAVEDEGGELEFELSVNTAVSKKKQQTND